MGRGRKDVYKSAPAYQASKEKVFTPEVNDQVNSLVLEVMRLPEIDRTDVERLWLRVGEYLEICDKHNNAPGNLGLYLAMGINKGTADDWEKGSRGKAHSDLIKRAKGVIAAIREARMSSGQLNVVAGIFWQKNYDGLSDKTEIQVSNSDSLNEIPAEELQQKYINSVAVPEIEEKTE